MIGIFDSGVGGFNSLKPLRNEFPFLDIVYLADRKNAPYGTKTEEEILRFACQNIKRLTDMGASAVLIACCTASTLWNKLPEKWRNISLPIITPTVKMLTEKEEKVLVIATEQTVRSQCFKREIANRVQNAKVTEVAMQSLVSAVERGVKNKNLEEETKLEMQELLRLAMIYEPDTLVLGCTHFSSVENIIRGLMPNVKIINPAKIGALAIANYIRLQGIRTLENGKILYT